MRPDEVRIPVCPLCVSPVETEHGYDGPYYTWTCDHEDDSVVNYGQPETMTLAQYMDPERRENLRMMWCLVQWESLREACEAKRLDREFRDYATLKHPLDLSYTPADRRARKDFRDLSRFDAMHAVLRHVWAPGIGRAMAEESLLFQKAAVDDMNRQAYGE